MPADVFLHRFMVSRCFLLICAALGSVPVLAADVPPALELVQTWNLYSSGRFEASGLLVRDGRFLVVSDRHDHTIFVLEFDGDNAQAVPFVNFNGPEPIPSAGRADLEGIAAAADGGFYLVSELGFAPFHVPAGGGEARWLSPDLRPVAGSVGLFATDGGSLEGIAALGDDHLLLACERGPRGLIEMTGLGEPRRVAVQKMDTSCLPAAREVDWSDLATWRGRVFGLARNQQLVVELIRAADGSWREGAAWSYAAAEEAPACRFPDMKYGQGEGLAITDDRIYVMIDSNNQERVASPGDSRSWLFAFANPIEP